MFKRYALFLILALFLCGCGENGSKSVFESDNGGKYGKTWTVIGTYNGDFESFCGPRGEFQPGVGKYAVRCFVYDMHSKKLLSPLDPFKGSKRELLNGYLPAAKVVWENGGVSFECVNFVPHDKNVCLSRVVIKNTAKTVRKLRMSEACVPNMVTGGYADNKSLSLRGRNTVLCDGKPFLVCDEKFDCGGVCSSKDADTDITSYLIAGKLPRTKKSSGKCGNTYSSAVCYNLKLKPGASKTFCFASGSAVSPKTFGSELKRFSNFWEKTLKNVRISLPDKRAENCWYANLAYMLIMCDNGVSKPGAVAYDAFWVRDFAYFADTFFFADKYDFVKSGIEYLKTLHLSNGGFAH